MTQQRVKISYDGVIFETILPTYDTALLFARRWFVGTFATEDSEAAIAGVISGHAGGGAVAVNSQLARSIAISVHTAWTDFPNVDAKGAAFEMMSGMAEITVTPFLAA